MYSTALATRPDIAPPGSSGLSRDIVSILLPAFAIEGRADLADLDLGQSLPGLGRPCLDREKQHGGAGKLLRYRTPARRPRSRNPRAAERRRGRHAGGRRPHRHGVAAAPFLRGEEGIL